MNKERFMMDEVRKLFFTPRFYSRLAGCHVGESVLHYETEGWRMGLNPHPLFDTVYFMKRYANGSRDVSPFQLYERISEKEFPVTTSFFQLEFYLHTHEDIASAGINPMEHYITLGIAEGRQPNPWYLLERPSLPPNEFWEQVGTLDGYINSLDQQRLVDATWLSQAMGLPTDSAHAIFWRNRYENPACWPMNPESVLGSIHPRNFTHLDEFSAALELLIDRPSQPARH